jgi:hypothetical protein
MSSAIGCSSLAADTGQAIFAITHRVSQRRTGWKRPGYGGSVALTTSAGARVDRNGRRLDRSVPRMRGAS